MRAPIRILHVFGRLDRGGAETMIMNLYRKIDRSRIQFDFVIHTDDRCEYNEEILMLGGKIYNAPRYNIVNHTVYRQWWNVFFENHDEIKIVHGHMRSTASIYLKIANNHGLNTIAHSHSISSGKGPSAIVKDILQYRIRFIANHFFACSLEAGEWLFGKKIRNNKNFYVVKNAIDIDKFMYNTEVRSEFREKLGIYDKYVIGHVGRFHPSKNHVKIIRIFEEIHKNNADTHLLLIGNGELKGSLVEKIKGLGIEHAVTILDSTEIVERYYQVMDVFLMPSLYEGLGMVLVEAQAAGLPCIISEKVPREAIITDNVIIKELAQSESEWVKELQKLRSFRRNKINSINNEYNINDSLKWIESFYLNL